MAENKQYDQELKLQIREGLSAIVLPELGKRDDLDDLIPTSEEEALGKLNSFLEELNTQGVDIVSILDIEVNVGKRPGDAEESTEPRKFAIVRKGRQG